MISRHWTGIARRDAADQYIAHLENETFPRLASLPGFLRATILRREVDAGTEFRIVSVWESEESIRAFAGADVEAAVVPDAVQPMMVAYERRAIHYEIVTTVDAGKPARPDVP
jgi:heme-degrading monooxygenase HmoA